jgi:hypothetical protein
MSNHIKIHWVGTRKDSGRGSVWGWFTETGKRETPLPYYYRDNDDPPKPKCHMFYGSIGKELHIIEFELTTEFLAMMDAKQKNFRTADAEKLVTRWGKRFEEDLSMYLLMLKMKG